MNEPEKNIILNALLDKYERSIGFAENRVVSRRIILNLYNGGKSDFLAYQIDDVDCRILMNKAVEDLRLNGLIGRDWMNGQENHIISRVWLNIERLQEIYELIGRTPKSEVAQELTFLLKNALERISANWARECLAGFISNAEQRRSLSTFLPSDLEGVKEFLEVIVAAAVESDSEILERAFSIKALGDSKKFENLYRARLIRLLKHFYPNATELSDEEVLNQVGIIKYPEQISFCGKLKLIFPNGMIDFSLLLTGAHINAIDAKDSEISIDAKKIMFIENKANYVDYIRNRKKDDELVIFHGGCYSPAKAVFFKKIKETSLLSTKFYHWGDIDLGGFSMLARLRQNIFSSILAYRMDKTELIQYIQHTKSINNEYANKLKALLLIPELEDLYPSISYMIENKVKLEQEVMIE